MDSITFLFKINGLYGPRQPTKWTITIRWTFLKIQFSMSSLSLSEWWLCVCVVWLALIHTNWSLLRGDFSFLISHLTCLLFALALRVLHGGFERSKELLVN